MRTIDEIIQENSKEGLMNLFDIEIRSAIGTSVGSVVDVIRKVAQEPMLEVIEEIENNASTYMEIQSGLRGVWIGAKEQEIQKLKEKLK